MTRTESAPAAPEHPVLPARQPDTYESAYTDGYVQGVRDASAWSVDAFGRLLRAAEAARAVADAFVDQAKSEVENAQRRWAENANIRDYGQTEALAETARGHVAEARERRAAKPRAKRAVPPAPKAQVDPAPGQAVPVDPGPSQPMLSLDSPEAPAPPEPVLTEEQRMRRAAGHAWRA